MMDGSQDGVTWFTLVGKTHDDKITVDFSPIGGPKHLNGTFSADSIKWADGNVWSKLAVPSFKIHDDTTSK